MASVQTKDYIVQLIKEEILSGVMKPGEELAQEALAERLGVSRMPITESCSGGICGTSSKSSYPGSSFECTADS